MSEEELLKEQEIIVRGVLSKHFEKWAKEQEKFLIKSQKAYVKRLNQWQKEINAKIRHDQEIELGMKTLTESNKLIAKLLLKIK